MRIITARVPGGCTPGPAPGALQDGLAAAEVDGLLRGPWAQRSADLSLLQHQSTDLLPVEKAVRPQRLSSLEEHSRRPKRLRQPTWSRELALAVLHLPEQYPRWGKDKLVILLRRRGWQMSTSMVGRILTHLKARGVLRESPRTGISTRKRLWRRPYAVRKPKGYAVKDPGDLVQVDTRDA